MTSTDVATGTSRSYALVGFIFYVLGAVGWVIGTSAMMFTAPFWWGEVSPRMPMGFSFVPLGIFGAISIGFTVWSWITLKNIERGLYTEARTSCLVLGIFGLFLAWLVGGIFFILAYAKLGEVAQPAATVRPPPQRFCTSCGRAVSPDAKFCAICGKELPP